VEDTLRRFKAEFFKALAHPARLKILELLRSGELSVNELQTRLELEPSAVSQHLAVLRGKNIVETRKVGTSVYYRVRDPEVAVLLDSARRIFNNQLIDTRAMLEQLEGEAEAAPARRKPARRAG
jgi:DNA-binding transcriptional ArsR family regulator